MKAEIRTDVQYLGFDSDSNPDYSYFYIIDTDKNNKVLAQTNHAQIAIDIVEALNKKYATSK